MSEETAAETTQTDTDVADGGGATETPAGLFDGLSDDLKGHEAFKGVENIEQLAKAHVDALGKLADVPKAPEKADAYDIGDVKTETIGWDETAETSFREAGLAAGLTQDQFKAMIDWAVNRSGEIGKALEAQKAEASESLRKDWGQNYDTNMKKVGKVLSLAFGEKAAEMVTAMGIGNLPEAAKQLLEFSGKLSEDLFVDGNAAPSGDKTAAETLYPNQGKK